MAKRARFRLAVWKLASCDGCQLTLLDLEEELLALAGRVELAYFREATSRASNGPFDLSLVDGSVTQPRDVALLDEIRHRSQRVVAIGACATAGGIQALRNFTAVDAYLTEVYPSPDLVSTLPTSTPVREHVPVDGELFGCPIQPRQLLELLTALLEGRRPRLVTHSVCLECKSRGNVCVLVTGTPCLGPITRAGCGALCPSFERGCYGCFGPMETPDTKRLVQIYQALGVSAEACVRALRLFYANAPEFRRESDLLAHGGKDASSTPRGQS